MERKEHPVATISGGGKVLKLLDPDGNPYTPPDPVDYQILDEDGEVLKEGTVKDSDEIPLDDVSATSFRVMIDSHLVLDTKGFESPAEDEDQKTIDGPSFDPDDDTLDEFVKPNENQKGEGGDDASARDDSGNDDQDEKSGGDDDDSSSDESKDSDESSDSNGDEGKDSDSDDSKDSDDQDGDKDKDADDSKGSDDDSGDSDKKSTDDDDQ